MNKITFVTQSYSRKAQYRISTKGIDTDDTKFFRKEALNPSSTVHLMAMRETYQAIKKIGAESYFAAIIGQTESSLDFEYLPGISLEAKLVDAIVNNDQATTIGLLGTYRDVLESLSIRPTAHHIHTKTQRYFGPTLYKKFPGSTCILPGLLDLNFDNVVLQQNGQLKIFDYEWSFKHCLPLDYVFARSIMWLALRHTELLRLHCSQITLLELAPGIHLPDYILTTYPTIAQQIELAYGIEWDHFQKAIAVSLNHHSPVKFYRKPRPVTMRPFFSLEQLELQSNHALNLEKERALLKKGLVDTDRHQQYLAHELAIIKSSGSYKLATKISRLLRLVSLRHDSKS